MKLKNKIIIATVLISISGGIFSKAVLSNDKIDERKNIVLPIVKTYSTKKNSLYDYIKINGNLIHQSKASVTVNITNQIENIRIENGQKVRTNEILIELDSSDYRYSLQSMLSQKEMAILKIEKAKIALIANKLEIKKYLMNLKKMKDERDFAENYYLRQKEIYESRKILFQNKAISKLDFKSTEENYLNAKQAFTSKDQEFSIAKTGYEDYNFTEDSAEKIIQEKSRAKQNDLKSSQAELKRIINEIIILKNKIQQCTVRSPISGYITGLTCSKGERPEPGKNLLTVINSDKLQIIISLPVKYLKRIHNGTNINFKSGLYPDKTFSAKICIINEIADPQSRTIEIRALFNNHKNLFKPGMFVETIINTNYYENVQTIPANSVQQEGEKFICYLIKNNKAIKYYLTNPLRIDELYVLNSKDNIALPVADLLNVKLHNNCGVRTYE